MIDHESISSRKCFNDRLARIVISTVGVGTIIAVLLILFVITIEILPLFKSAELSPISHDRKAHQPISLGMDPWLEKGYSIDKEGRVQVFHLRNHNNAAQGEEPSPSEGMVLLDSPEDRILRTEKGHDGSTTLTLSDGSLQREELRFRPVYNEASIRHSELKREAPTKVRFSNAAQYGLSRVSDDGAVLFAQIDRDGKVDLRRITERENFLGEVETEIKDHSLNLHPRVDFLTANSSGTILYTFDAQGMLSFWKVGPGAPKLINSTNVPRQGRSVVDVEPLIGSREVALGFDNGEVEIYSIANQRMGNRSIEKIHSTQLSKAAIHQLYASPRNRTLFAVDVDGALIVWYSTSQRTLAKEALSGPTSAFAISRRGHGFLMSDDEKLTSWKWDASHPEAGLQAIFGKVWYAGYAKPGYHWQSSSGSDDFEPKISLVPLIFGSLKGSLYAVLFSVPFAVLAALYTSVFAGSRLRAIVKPTIEMMAAVPSVVVGFLAALWLAPLVDRHLLTLLFGLPFCLVMLGLTGVLSLKSKGRDLLLHHPGWLVLISAATILISFILASYLGAAIESSYFQGNFRLWLVNDLKVDYDMRNSMIIGVALGFAVIPIIYTLSEDAMSSVPPGLTSASLALGATPWQTAWRVVLPAASPGIFAAITLGLGRAVGETMIVLMCTGNTPIIDMNLFEGFRALSANIAVEMPEAAKGGTLYRVLFLSAGLLLVFTSILNTITEFIRQRLARQFARY